MRLLRMLDEKKLLPYTHMLWTTDYGKKWFDQARFDWVIMSTKNQFTGESYSLVPYLLGQGKWDVSFKLKDSQFIFVAPAGAEKIDFLSTEN